MTTRSGETISSTTNQEKLGEGQQPSYQPGKGLARLDQISKKHLPRDIIGEGTKSLVSRTQSEIIEYNKSLSH